MANEISSSRKELIIPRLKEIVSELSGQCSDAVVIVSIVKSAGPSHDCFGKNDHEICKRHLTAHLRIKIGNCKSAEALGQALVVRVYEIDAAI